MTDLERFERSRGDGAEGRCYIGVGMRQPRVIGTAVIQRFNGRFNVDLRWLDESECHDLSLKAGRLGASGPPRIPVT